MNSEEKKLLDETELYEETKFWLEKFVDENRDLLKKLAGGD